MRSGNIYCSCWFLNFFDNWHFPSWESTTASVKNATNMLNQTRLDAIIVNSFVISGAIPQVLNLQKKIPSRQQSSVLYKLVSCSILSKLPRNAWMKGMHPHSPAQKCSCHVGEGKLLKLLWFLCFFRFSEGSSSLSVEKIINNFWKELAVKAASSLICSILVLSLRLPMKSLNCSSLV